MLLTGSGGILLAFFYFSLFLNLNSCSYYASLLMSLPVLH